MELGEDMARQVFAASQPPTPWYDQAGDGSGGGDGAIAQEGKGWTAEEARALRAARSLKRILNAAKSKKDSKLDATCILQVRISRHAVAAAAAAAASTTVTVFTTWLCCRRWLIVRGSSRVYDLAQLPLVVSRPHHLLITVQCHSEKFPTSSGILTGSGLEFAAN